MQKIRLAVFASGTGSNAVNLIHYFKQHASIEIGVIVCNRPEAPVLRQAQALHVDTRVITNENANDGNYLVELMKNSQIDGIVLAGYLRRIPRELIQHFPNRMINLHPSLLPKYGGAGMYGNRVHETVLANHEEKSGITIHFVNEEYDEGGIIAQFELPIHKGMTLEDLKTAIHALEQEQLPLIVERTFEK